MAPDVLLKDMQVDLWRIQQVVDTTLLDDTKADQLQRQADSAVPLHDDSAVVEIDVHCCAYKYNNNNCCIGV